MGISGSLHQRLYQFLFVLEYGAFGKFKITRFTTDRY